METIFRDKVIFENSIISTVQSNTFPPPPSFIAKFKTYIRSAFPNSEIKKDKFEPKPDGTPPIMQQLGLVPKKAMTMDEMLTIMVKGKYDQPKAQCNQTDQNVTQHTNIPIDEGTIEVTSGSDAATVFFGEGNLITVDSVFYDAVKVIGPPYDKDAEERIFYIKSAKGKTIALTKDQAKTHKLAYVLRISGIDEPGSTLEVDSSKRPLATNGCCSD